MERHRKCTICETRGKYVLVGGEMIILCDKHNLMIEDNPEQLIEQAMKYRDGAHLIELIKHG